MSDNQPPAGQAAPQALSASPKPAVVTEQSKAGTLASDVDEVKTYPPHFIREKIHTGNGHFKWSEPFDPAVRAREEAEAAEARMKQRGSFPEPDPDQVKEIEAEAAKKK